MVAGGGYDVTGAIDCRIGAQRAQNAQAGHYVADTSGTIDAHYYKGCGSAAFAEREVVACLTDGAHNGGGLNGQDAYSGRIFAVNAPVAHNTQQPHT